MSRYCVVKTIFKDTESLISALMETSGWTKSQIEVHNVPQNLFGYRGDRREQKANIIIRRKYIGSLSNDIGFIRNDDGNYETIVSAYDSSKYGTLWIGKLKGNYAFHRIRIEQESRGRNVERTRCENGHQLVEVTGYR